MEIKESDNDISHPEIAEAMHDLKETLPWIKFVAIFFYVIAGLVPLSLLGMMFGGSKARTDSTGIAILFFGGALVFVLTYLPGSFLFKYAKGAELYLQTRQVGTMENAV